MDTVNRREYFRHTFGQADRPCVELRPFGPGEAAAPLVGRAVDLSMGGVTVLLSEEIAPDSQNRLWSVRFALPDGPKSAGSVTVKCRVIHWHRSDEGFVFGFQFCGIEAPSQAGLRRVLWRFLLNESPADAEEASPPEAPEGVGPFIIDIAASALLPPEKAG
jgi:c-di-GMP-binding flagellar brake protein YcgR